MKLISDILYIEWQEAIDCGLSDNTLKNAKLRKSPSWKFIDDPSDARKVLIQFDKMKDEYKRKIEARFGNPYEYVARTPIRNMVKLDVQAEHYYLAYRYDLTKTLPVEHVKKYTLAASWLNMLKEANADKKVIKNLLNLSIDDFYIQVLAIIKQDGIDLPGSYPRLLAKRKEYEAKGYESLIDWRFGNKIAAKVNDELCEAVLLEMISHGNQHNDVVIAMHYNKWAKDNGHKEIHHATVGVWRKKNEHQVMGSRNGNSAWYDKYGKSIRRKRPSAPLLHVGADDNDLDLYFFEEVIKRDKVLKNYYYRPKLIVVMDSFNDYILGYAYGDTVTAELVRAAWANAMHHIKELTGSWYLPHQIQTDRWGNDTLTDYYKAIGTYTPATAKLARAKYIEQAFGTNWHNSLKMFANYSGHNITAKSKTNRDLIEANKSNFPAKEVMGEYIALHIERLRMLTNEKGITRKQLWMDSFKSSQVSQERLISDENMLLLFGDKHDYPNTITNKGLTPILLDEKRVYDIPDELYLKSVGKTVSIIYDRFDLSRVLVTDGGSLRFLASENQAMPSAIRDYKEGDRARLNYLLMQKKAHAKGIAEGKEQRRALLEREQIDAESILQAGVLIKEIKQRAERNILPAAVIEGNGFEDFDPDSMM